jgi:DNA-binding beta-propeller fold protein YncE
LCWHCYAGDLAGCATDTPATVTFSDFGISLYVAIDTALDSVYVSMQNDDALVIVDTRTCNASDLSGCAALSPPTIHTGADPEGVVLDSQTQTLYTANEVDNDISVISASQCNAQVTSGCRMPPPAVSVPGGPGLPAVDQSVHTVYVPTGEQDLAMINTNVCNATDYQGCATPPSQATVGSYPQAAAVDPRTGTVYVADAGAGAAGSVSVVSAATCNATTSAGCASVKTLQVPAGNPVNIAVDAVTNTIYVAASVTSGPDLIWVLNGATCDAENSAGCDQVPSELQVADSGGEFSNALIAVNDQTNTVYATVLYADQNDDSLYVINGATCDAFNTSGCDQMPATVTVGDDEGGLAVDQATDTVYVVNFADGDYPGTVSVVNGATCNGNVQAGCGQTPAAVAAGFGAWEAAVDPGTHDVYVTDIQDASVSVINGATCNGMVQAGCGQAPSYDAAGNYPFEIALDPGVSTAYVVNYDSIVSVIPLDG